MIEPIKTQNEADQVFEYLVINAMAKINIDREQAEKRVRKIFSSGILENGNPTSRKTQREIDKILKTPVK